ncbi:MAG TPA: SpoIIE family protein phosphatase [Acidobacteriaceae bacterium]|nr:SpoIIE family protein phosphatase [Acidobacteriaceae bacterium]
MLGLLLLAATCHADDDDTDKAHSQAPAPVQPQSAPGVFNFAEGRDPSVLLNGVWRFHLGDDPDGSRGWASAGFNDSSWPTIQSGRGWLAQGFHDTDGTAWYRATVQLPANAGPLSLYITSINDSSQVYANGQLIGQFGGMPPHPYANASQVGRVYQLPQLASDAPQALTLAIRVWRWPRWANYTDGGMTDSIRIGASSLLAEEAADDARTDAWEGVNDVLLITLEVLGALAALGFFILRRGEREYLWFAVVLLFWAASRCQDYLGVFYAMPIKWSGALDTLLDTGGHVAEITFYFLLLRGRRNWLFLAALGCVAAEVLLLLPMSLEAGNFTTWNTVHVTLDFPIRLWILALLFQRTRRGLADARLLLFPVLLQQAVGILDQVFTIGKTMGMQNLPPHWFDSVAEWPFSFSVKDAADVLFLFAMIAIFLYRSDRAARKQEQMTAEMEAARIVQQVLIPEEIPRIPGFLIHTVYKPYGEVGGDFFQILPVPGGGAVIAIGDVSGKGMPAAMTVSLLVGTLRTLAHYTQSPGEILSAMNTRMLARSNGGFTTCLILRVDPDGMLTAASAGHIAPYLNGVEMAIEYSLPLGITAETVYPEATVRLAPNTQLTMLSDGIVEARNKSGELFGFDRTAAIATETAEAIAEAAAQFGQDDDITVLTCVRPGAGGEASMQIIKQKLATA